MAAVKELIRAEADGSISFGDYELASKTKKQDFEYQGDLYKVKTFREITKLERNDMFVYESVPGTAVEHFRADADSVEFQVEGPEDAQITLGMEDDTEYLTLVDGVSTGAIKTGLGGKLVLSVELGSRRKYRKKAVWQRAGRRYFSARTAGMNPPSGWGSARAAESGIPLWKRLLKKRAPERREKRERQPQRRSAFLLLR